MFTNYICIHFVVQGVKKNIYILILKLDGVGPVDNRSSTYKLHHIVEEKEEEKIGTCDT